MNLLAFTVLFDTPTETKEIVVVAEYSDDVVPIASKRFPDGTNFEMRGHGREAIFGAGLRKTTLSEERAMEVVRRIAGHMKITQPIDPFCGPSCHCPQCKPLEPMNKKTA